MTQVILDLRPLHGANSSNNPDQPIGIRIAVGEFCFTRLLRAPHNAPDDCLIAPPAMLAFWLCDNWWRLRWEGMPAGGPDAQWRLAHETSAIGGGFAWPRVCIWGDVDRIGFLSQADPVGVVGPVRYLTTATAFTDARHWEAVTDRFLAAVADERTGYGSDRPALRALIETLETERADPAISRWRRLEARLAYDPDAAPAETVAAAEALAATFDLESVEEGLAAAPGAAAVTLLEQQIGRARGSDVACRLAPLVAAVGPIDRAPRQQPWQIAESLARQVREMTGTAPGPLRNKRLADLLQMPTSAITKASVFRGEGFGLRVQDSADPDLQRVAFGPNVAPTRRRFDLCRALGDSLWAQPARLGPLTDTGSARQQFQRAFAQHLLCPFPDLTGFLGTSTPDEDDIAEAARWFHVSPYVVKNVLRNNGVVARDRFHDLPDAA